MPCKYSTELKQQVVEAVKQNPDMTYAEIAHVFSVPNHCVYVWANEAGVARRPRKAITRTMPEPDANVPTLESDELVIAINKTQQQLADLLRLKEETTIRFEREGSLVSVYGLGAQPLVADFKHWLRFLRREGAAKLRQFIDDDFGTGDVRYRVQ